VPTGRRIAIILLTSLTSLLPSAVLGAVTPEDFRVSDFYRDTGPSPAPPSSRRVEGMSRAFDALLGGRVFPIPCSSSLLLDLRRHRDNLPDPIREALRSLTARPALLHDEAHQTRDGRYTIHYTTDPSSPDAIDGMDADFNGLPDRIDRVIEALDHAALVLNGQKGWPLPVASSRSNPYDIYLANLGSGRDGLAVPDREIPATPQDDASSHIVIDSGLDAVRVEASVAHQFAHASLMALSTRSAGWWTEATAAWLEAEVTGDPGPFEAAVSRRLERLDLSLTGDSLLLSQGNYLWVSFLADRLETGSDLIRQIWVEQSLRGGDPVLASLRETLRRAGEGGIREAFREFTRWSLFTGPRDDSGHFLLGGLLPSMTPRATYETFPVESAGLEVVEPLGAAFYRFVGDGSRGGLRIRCEAEGADRLEVELVITPPGRGRRPYLVELVPDASGRAEIGVPWRSVAEAIMIVRNSAIEGRAARFRYSAQIDPLFPYDLSSFTALPSAGGITLQWSTALESDLLGWNVYRSSHPTGPFVRVNPVTLPSGGDSDEETDYIYQDTAASGGHRYFFLVEGITLQGLPERSFPISARAGESAPSP